MVAASQKASSFLLLIAFTHFLSPAEYGEIALLTVVGVLLMATMTLGLEPRIIYAYFRLGDEAWSYLRAARRASIFLPIITAVAMVAALALLPVSDPTMWMMECTGACLLAAGTTYSYAILRAGRRSRTYAAFTLGLLVALVSSRVAFVALFDWGALGWAASDLTVGFIALVVGPLVARGPRADPGAAVHRESTVVRDGLPLVPHYIAQWGLSLSDRLVLVIFVPLAAIGVYSAIYQIAAVISLVLNEVNRAFMPSYARLEVGDRKLPALVRLHLQVTLIIYGTLFVAGFAAAAFVLPDEYVREIELYPALALGALIYGLYFIPMNGLTLTAGSTTQAPIISLGALVVNVALNLLLGGPLGLWGAAIATLVSYTVLVTLAAVFSNRARAIKWRECWRGYARLPGMYLATVAVSLCATYVDPTRILQLIGLSSLVAVMIWRVSTDILNRERDADELTSP